MGRRMATETGEHSSVISFTSVPLVMNTMMRKECCTFWTSTFKYDSTVACAVAKVRIYLKHRNAKAIQCRWLKTFRSRRSSAASPFSIIWRRKIYATAFSHMQSIFTWSKHGRMHIRGSCSAVIEFWHTEVRCAQFLCFRHLSLVSEGVGERYSIKQAAQRL